MTPTTHSARITGPVLYGNSEGPMHRIPLGPCLLEQVDEHLFDIIWGAQGQRSAELPVDVVEAAQQQGHLVLID